jgi:hypothetical protein
MTKKNYIKIFFSQNPWFAAPKTPSKKPKITKNTKNKQGMVDMGSRKLKFGPNIANKLATNVTESFWTFFLYFGNYYHFWGKNHHFLVIFGHFLK